MEDIKTRINTIYYLDSVDRVKEFIVYDDKKVKIREAEELFNEKGIGYNKILKILLEDLYIKIPLKDLQEYEKVII